MDKTALAATDITSGTKILEILDHADLGINLAMWLYAPEYEDWRLALSSRHLDEAEPSKAYGLIYDALKQAQFSLEFTPPPLIFRMTDLSVRTLRRMFGKAKSVEGMRLGGQMIGNQFLEDAVVYRIR